MAKRKPEIRDDFVKKKKVGPDKLKEAEYDSRTKLMLFLEKIRIIAYFVMNIIFDFLKRYEIQNRFTRR